MKKLLILLAVVAMFIAVHFAKEPDLTQTIALREYCGSITVRRDSFSPTLYNVELIGGLSSSNRMAELINPNQRIIGYLVANALDLPQILQQLEDGPTDSIHINRKFQQLIASQKLFKTLSLRLTGKFLQTKKGIKPHIEKSYTLDSLAQIASRFYYAIKFDNQGNIHWKVGTTRNGLTNLPLSQRDLLVEAFAFDLFSANYSHSPNTPFRRKLRNIAKNIVTPYYNSSNKHHKYSLDEIRKKFYHEFAESQTLRQAIMDHYRLKKEYLDFNLICEGQKGI